MTSLSAQDNDIKKSLLKGKIKGIVLDKNTGHPIESVSVGLFSEVDISLTGSTRTDKSGAFAIEVPYGIFQINVEYSEYQYFLKRKTEVTSDNPEVILDTIYIEPGVTTEEIEVIDKNPFMENQVYKKVYNFEKIITVTGGSMIDALKNIPSISIDPDNKIYLRGSSNVEIQINGMPSAMLNNDPGNIMRQIPSELIESIEIINNPSAKYDAEGISGIINIELKRKQVDGYNIGFILNAGTKDKYSTSINFNGRFKKFNLYCGYDYRLTNMFGTGKMYRETIISDSLFTFNQNSDNKDKMETHYGFLGVDYELSKADVLSLSSSLNFRGRINTDNSYNVNFSPRGNKTSIFNKASSRDENSYNVDIIAGHKHIFSSPKEELISSFAFSSNHNKNPVSIVQNEFYSGVLQLYQIDSTNSDMSFITFQSDYTQQFGNNSKTSLKQSGYNIHSEMVTGQENGSINSLNNNDKAYLYNHKFEAGIKAFVRNINSDYRSNYLNAITQTWTYNQIRSNNFDYQDKVFSAYSTYTNNISGIGYQLGMRIEESLIKSTQAALNINSENNYFSYFPSIYLLKSINATSDILASYSRRINRPNIYQLNPFIDYTDPQNLRKGNPNLKPEYINSFELSYNKYFSSAIFTGSLYYRQVNDVINWVYTAIDSSISVNTLANISKSDSYGIELIFGGSITKWLSLNGNIGYSKTSVSGDIGQGVLESSGESWSGKLISSLSIGKLFDFQISYQYIGKIIQAQSTTGQLQMLDVAVKKDFFNKLASFTFRISDPFNSLQYSVTTNSLNYHLNSNKRRDTRIAYLTLAINIASEKTDLKRK